MGRPRKRQRTDASPLESSPPRAGHPVTQTRPIEPAPDIFPAHVSYDGELLDPSLTTIDLEREQAASICTIPMAKTVQSQAAAYQNPSSISQDSSSIPTSNDWDGALAAYPTDFNLWPDFSTLDVLPLPVEDNYAGVTLDQSLPHDPDANPEALNNLPSTPACPCLPNLYLTLSTLATLKSFPFTRQTITTIESSYKTSQGVIYCNVCPQKFDSGSSNLMLGCTLLNVLADQWNRFRHLSVDDLRKSFGTPAQQNTIISTKEGRDWRKFQQQVMKAYVFGDTAIPHPPGCPNSPAVRSVSSVDTDETCTARVPPLTLMGLCDALERRQKQWHRLEDLTDEFPDRISSDLQLGHMVGHSDASPGKHLCLEIVGHAKCMIKSLETSFSCS